MIHRALALFIACSVGGSALAQTAAPAPKPAASKPAARASAASKKKKSEAGGKVLAAETVEAITQAQLDIAARVLTGDAQCEFNQLVSIAALDGQPGRFKLRFKNLSYSMVPAETTTGAVRLEDKKAGVVWLQIPTKSMLMNSKLGQRMVDGCTQVEQRIAVEAAVAAAAAAAASAASAAASAPEPAASAASAPEPAASQPVAPEKPASAP